MAYTAAVVYTNVLTALVDHLEFMLIFSSVTLYVGITPSAGGYIGERTVAAHVLKDNYKLIRAGNQFDGRSGDVDMRDRMLWLEVCVCACEITLPSSRFTRF